MYQEKSSLMSKQIRTGKKEKVVVYQQNEIDRGQRKRREKKMLKAWEAENTTGHTQRVRIIISFLRSQNIQLML